MTRHLGFERLLDRTPRELAELLRRRYSPNPLQHFSSDHPAVFTLSTGRVGTRTLAALLRSAPNLAAHHEPLPHLYGLSQFAYRHDGNAELGDIGGLFLSLRRDLLEDALARRRGYAETSPQVTFLAPAIHKQVPSCRFIHLVRHPYEVIASGLQRRWYGGNRYDPTRITPKAGSDWGDRWPRLAEADQIAWLWAETNHWITNTLSALPADISTTIQSDRMFAGCPETLATLFKFVNADVPSHRAVNRVLQRQLNASPQRGPVRPEVSPAAKELLQPMADTLGYDL